MNLGYGSQYTDPETGPIFLRSRYYDPATAHSVSRDPLASPPERRYAHYSPHGSYMAAKRCKNIIIARCLMNASPGKRVWTTNFVLRSRPSAINPCLPRPPGFPRASLPHWYPNYPITPFIMSCVRYRGGRGRLTLSLSPDSRTMQLTMVNKRQKRDMRNEKSLPLTNR